MDHLKQGRDFVWVFIDVVLEMEFFFPREVMQHLGGQVSPKSNVLLIVACRLCIPHPISKLGEDHHDDTSDDTGSFSSY